MEITIETIVQADLDTAWSAWTTPEDITQWNFALEEWCCPKAEIDLRVGGDFNYRMEAKDGSFGFDFFGTFTAIDKNNRIEYILGDNRKVKILFSENEKGIHVVETFEIEDVNSAEQQRQGWQNILNNFKKHVERKHR